MSATKSISVLVVDDVKAVRDTLCRMLKKEGFEIFSAENGAEALKIVQSKKIDAIITDVQMPELNGTDLLDEVKKMKNGIRVFLMTGAPGLLDSKKCKNADGIIPKPFNIGLITTALRTNPIENAET